MQTVRGAQCTVLYLMRLLCSNRCRLKAAARSCSHSPKSTQPAVLIMQILRAEIIMTTILQF